METNIRLRGLVEGEARGPLLVRPEPISFYGEVDPETGALYGTGASVAGKILVTKGSRGSTVGPYILYALAKNGKKPLGIVVTKAEPLLVAGAVMAEIPLAEGLPESLLAQLAGQNCTAVLRVEPPEATLMVKCD